MFEEDERRAFRVERKDWMVKEGRCKENARPGWRGRWDDEVEDEKVEQRGWVRKLFGGW